MIVKKFKRIILSLSFYLIVFTANSQIVYTDVNPDSTVSEFQNGYAIDFNNDAKTDMHLVLLSGGGIYIMRLIPDDAADDNYVINLGGDGGGADVLNINDNITSSSNWYKIGSGWGDLLYGYWPDDGEYGHWTNTQTNKYLGIKFKIGSNFHYGWIHLTTHIFATDNMEFIIKGYAYNTIPDEEILAGETDAPYIVTLTKMLRLQI